jgi:signal transduction histidine kinase
LIPHSFIRIFSLIDITELKVTYRKLQKLNNTLEEKVKQRTTRIHHLLKQKDDFVNQLGHDLKNPLGPLLNLLPLLLNEEEDEKKKEMITVMIRNTGYMKNLVVKTIELAKLNSPNTMFRFKTLNLNEIVDRIIEANQILFQEKKIDITNTISKDIFISADQLRIEELFSNLVNNAVKYSHTGGNIMIMGTVEDHMVRISIKDEGIGMTQNQIDHVFDEFYKADGSRHDFDSSGLGMPICKRIVEKHHGQIWAESKGPDNGTTIFFTLPLDKSQMNADQRPYHKISEEIDTILQ